MFLFKKIKYLILSLVAFITIGVGVGVSYWVFANEGFNNAINSDSNIDNIYENYTFGKESITDKYDIYFFPSTYYLYRYASEKADVNGNPKYNENNPDPEDIYSYLEYFDGKLQVHGNSNAVSLDKSNQYHIDINGLSGSFSDLDSYTEYEFLNNPYSENLGTYLSIDIATNLNQKANYSGYIKISNTRTSLFDYKDVINVNYSGTEVGESFGGYNGIDETDLPQDNHIITDDDIANKDIYNKFERSETADPFFQVLEIDDRLGYWPTLDVTQGRYLPIKLSFDSYIDYKKISEIIHDPKTDMGDSNNWFTSKFSNRIYVNETNKKEFKDFLPVDGFEYKDEEYIFNFMSNLKQFADYDKDNDRYIIRLFPTFSNGKNYYQVEQAPDDEKTPASGYRDGIRLDYFTKVSNNSYSMDTRFFTFKAGATTNVNNGSNTLDYAAINNFSLSSNTATIELRGTKIEDDTWIKVNESNDNGSYNKDWLDFRDLNSKSLGENHIIQIDKDTTSTKLIDLFSPNHLYNIYIVGCKDNDEYYGSVDTAIKDIHDSLYDYVYNASSNQYEYVLKSGNDFPISDLKGKRLNDLGVFTIGGQNTKSSLKKSIYGVYAILYEEVSDLRLVQNISVGENINDNKYNEDENAKINTFVNDEVANSRGLIMNTDFLYKCDATNSSANQIIVSNLSNISSSNPYIYRIDGIDFRFADTLDFMIVVNGESNNSDLKFNLTPLEDKDGNDTKLISSAAVVEEGSSLKDEQLLFENASDYVENIDVVGTDGNSNKVTYKVLRLKAINGVDSGKGYYSFIFEYDPVLDGFNVYCYRFKNIFVKVFDTKPSEYIDESNDNYGFLNHSTGEYFTYEYFAGNSINVTEDLYTPVNSTAKDPLNLEGVFKYFVEKRVSSDISEGYYKDSVLNNKSYYYLMDSVSERVLGVATCTYNETGQQLTGISIKFSNNLELAKNYVFYLASKAYYENVIINS